MSLFGLIAGSEQKQGPDLYGRDDKGGVENVPPGFGHLVKDLCATDEAVLLAEACDPELDGGHHLPVGVNSNPPDQGLGGKREHIVTRSIAKIHWETFHPSPEDF